MIINEWVRAVEDLLVLGTRGCSQIIGLSSIEHGVGVSTLARTSAVVLAREGASVLLVDLAMPVDERPVQNVGTAQKVGHDEGVNLLTHSYNREGGFDVLTANPDREDMFLYSNAQALREEIRSQSSYYDLTIVDCPPFLANDRSRLNPMSAASACDALILVCARQHTRRRPLQEAVTRLRSAQIPLAGIAINEFGYLAPGAELAATLRRFHWAAPRLLGWLEKRARNSELLNN